MSNSRLEKFIYAICGMDVDDLPTPLSRIETLWNCLITGGMPDFEPLSRNEKYLMAMLTDNVDRLPEPTSRGEKLLYKIATGETDLSDVPGYLSRYEELLKQLIENGGIGGTDFEYVLYTLNQPLSTLYSTAEDIVNTATIYGDTVVNTLQEPSDLAVTPIGENIDISNTTVNGTVEGKVKSAILSGKTLVNLAQPSLRAWTMNLNSDTASLKATTDEFIIDWSKGVPFNAWIQARNDNSPVFGGMLKADTDYTFIIRILENNPTFEGVTVTGNVANLQMWGLRGYYSKSFSLQAGVTGTIALKYNFNKVATTTTQDIENIFGIAVPGTASNGTKTIDGGKLRISKDVIVLEGDYTNNYQDIPYFEGMQSVKMPVLTTIGKNLFDGELEYGGIDASTGNTNTATDRIRSKNFIKTNSQLITISRTNADGQLYIYEYNENKTFIRLINGGSPQQSFKNVSLSTNAKYIKIADKSNDLNTLIQIEESSIPTPYEPYKTNILSCNEEVTLRGIGDVKDTLDLTTGEYTKTIYEYTFTGDEGWQIAGGKDGGHTYFMFSSGQMPIKYAYKNDINVPILCDRLPVITHTDLDDGLKSVGINLSYFFRLNFSDCNSNDGATVEDLKAYLKANPTTVQYPISKSIKTVDLSILDQDGNETSHLHVFNDTTHISTSAECLLPNVVIPADISYPSIIKANTLYTVKLKRPVTNGNLLINLGGTEQLVTSDCFTIQTPATLTSQNVIFSGKGNVISEVTVVEGDHTEKEYGYFEGMQSVKMPVLTTTGKNLFDVNKGKEFVYNRVPFTKFDGSVYAIHVGSVDSVEIENDSIILNNITYANTVQLQTKHYVDEGVTYNISIINESGTSIRVRGITYYNQYGEILGGYWDRIGEITPPKGCNYLIVGYTCGLGNGRYKIQFEQGTTSTTYEPYKSNILSVNEDVTLRGIGDVQDTLDCLTGEVTERIGEIVLNGNSDETWVSKRTITINDITYSQYYLVSHPISNKNYSSATSLPNIISDKGITDPFNGLWMGGSVKTISVREDNGSYYFCMNFPKNEDIEDWLSQNPITIFYHLETESIKTVVLSTLDQDGQPTKLSTFNDVTHVSIEAEDLLPTVDLEVPTKIEETLSTLPTLMNDISETQQSLNESIDDQAENINEVSTAITEIHNDIL